MLSGTNDESITIGLDDLENRCKEFHERGCRAAKWRAVFKIDESKIDASPSALAMDENAHTLARYAKCCQENGLVPIVEPEVLLDGNYSIEVTAKATEKVLSKVFGALIDHDVCLENILLKPNMIRSGSAAKLQATPTEVGEYTFAVLQRTVPIAIGGIFFLSGGMSENHATECLNEINKVAMRKWCGVKPWHLSFSFGRALQKSCLAEWNGRDEAKFVNNAKKTLFLRAKANSLATMGNYHRDFDSKEESKIG
jgi:fructose-bisphosphate aldolase class I